jgi:hypothetical protein
MSGPDPYHLLAKASAKGGAKNPNAAARKAQALVLGKLFRMIATSRIEAGDAAKKAR